MEMPDRLTINEVTYVRAEFAEDNECAKQTCSYYSHYLVYYRHDVQGEKLEHAAFHAAEKRCSQAHETYFAWAETNPDASSPKHLEQQCEFWERKVAA